MQIKLFKGVIIGVIGVIGLHQLLLYFIIRAFDFINSSSDEIKCFMASVTELTLGIYNELFHSTKVHL